MNILYDLAHVTSSELPSGSSPPLAREQSFSLSLMLYILAYIIYHFPYSSLKLHYSIYQIPYYNRCFLCHLFFCAVPPIDAGLRHVVVVAAAYAICRAAATSVGQE